MSIPEYPNFFGRNLSSIILLILVYTIQQVEVQNPPIVRSCQDPLILDHVRKYAHTYCYHACAFLQNGIPVQNDTTVCTESGDCLCSYPCSNDAVITQPTVEYDSILCNPPRAVMDPPDPDPTALPRCMASCATQCPGGTGTICGEIDRLVPMMDTYAKICTCYCPIQRCIDPTTTPAGTSTSLIVLPPIVPLLTGPLLFLQTFKWKLLIFKFFKLCWLILKICGLWFIQSAFLGLYSFLFFEWISWEWRQVIWGLNFTLTSFRRTLSSYLDL